MSWFDLRAHATLVCSSCCEIAGCDKGFAQAECVSVLHPRVVSEQEQGLCCRGLASTHPSTWSLALEGQTRPHSQAPHSVLIGV